MTDAFKGIVAGGIATGAVTVLMMAQHAAGIAPHLHLTQLILVLLDAPREPALGWTVHFVFGPVVCGWLFAYLEPRLSANTHTKRGILFGLLLWLATMLVLMPAAGGGYFGFQLTWLAPIITAILDVAYGAVLGWTYGKLSPTHDPFATHHRAA